MRAGEARSAGVAPRRSPDGERLDLGQLEHHRAVLARAGVDPRAVGQLSADDRPGELALQRAAAELVVEALVREPRDELRVDGELDLALRAQALGDAVDDRRRDALH